MKMITLQLNEIETLNNRLAALDAQVDAHAAQAAALGANMARVTRFIGDATQSEIDAYLAWADTLPAGTVVSHATHKEARAQQHDTK